MQTGHKTNLSKCLKVLKKKKAVPSFKFFIKLTIFSSCQVCKEHLYNLSSTSTKCQWHPSNYAFSICFYNYVWHYSTLQKISRMQSWNSKTSSLNITSKKKVSLTLCWAKAMREQTNSQAPQCLVYLIYDTLYKLKTIPVTSMPPQKQ